MLRPQGAGAHSAAQPEAPAALSLEAAAWEAAHVAAAQQTAAALAAAEVQWGAAGVDGAYPGFDDNAGCGPQRRRDRLRGLRRLLGKEKRH